MNNSCWNLLMRKVIYHWVLSTVSAKKFWERNNNHITQPAENKHGLNSCLNRYTQDLMELYHHCKTRLWKEAVPKSSKAIFNPLNHGQYTEIMVGSSYWQRKETVGSTQKVAEYSSLSSRTIRGAEFVQTAQQSMNLELISSSNTEPVVHTFLLASSGFLLFLCNNLAFSLLLVHLLCWTERQEARQLIQRYTESDAAEENVSQTLGRCPNYLANFLQYTSAAEELGMRLKFHLSKSHHAFSV